MQISWRGTGWGLRIPSEHHQFWRGLARLRREVHFALKRTLDIVIAGLALIALSPLFLLVALLICIDSPGAPIFRQQRLTSRRRVDQYGEEIWEIEPFTCYKFRSMRHNCSCDLHKAFMKAFIANDHGQMNDLRGETCVENKLIHDPRVTRVGHFIRCTSIDELPQLWNVLTGEMSLVGPRPPIPYEFEMYQTQHRVRLAAHPGLTGWWQVTRRSAANFDEMVRLDLWYIEHQSLWLDLKIIFMTPLAVFSRKGAH